MQEITIQDMKYAIQKQNENDQEWNTIAFYYGLGMAELDLADLRERYPSDNFRLLRKDGES